MENGLVIYHHPTRVQSHNLIHEKIYLPTANAKVGMRSRRNRINRGGGVENLKLDIYCR